MPWLSTQNGPKIQNLEQTLVRLWSSQTHIFILFGQARTKAARMHLLSVDQRGLRGSHENHQEPGFKGHLCHEDNRPKFLFCGAHEWAHAHLGRCDNHWRRGLHGIQWLNDMCIFKRSISKIIFSHFYLSFHFFPFLIFWLNVFIFLFKNNL